MVCDDQGDRRNRRGPGRLAAEAGAARGVRQRPEEAGRGARSRAARGGSPPAEPQSGAPGDLALATAVLLFLCAYLYIEQPDWLFPDLGAARIRRDQGGEPPHRDGQRRPARRAVPPANRHAAPTRCSKPAPRSQGIDLPAARFHRLAPASAPTPASSSRWPRGEPLSPVPRQQLRSDRPEVAMRRRRGFTFIELLVVVDRARDPVEPGAAQVHRSQAPRPLGERHRRPPGRPPGRLQRVVRARRPGPPKWAPAWCRPGWCPTSPGGFTFAKAGVHARLGQLRAAGRRPQRRHAARRGGQLQQCRG